MASAISISVSMLIKGAFVELKVNIFHFVTELYSAGLLLVLVIILIFIYIDLALIMAIFLVPTRVWKHVVQKGDTVIDATCGNGFDTLAMLNLVSDDSHNGCVYALDIQKDALDNISLLLEESLNPNEVGTIIEQLVSTFNW